VRYRIVSLDMSACCGKKGRYILSDQNNTPVNPIVKPSTEDRKRIVKAMRRVNAVLRVETVDPQEQIKILLNTLGLRIARSQFDNPEDVAKIIQGVPMYVSAYRKDGGDYGL